MSFSEDVKKELKELFPKKIHCREAYALAEKLFAGENTSDANQVLKKDCCRRTFLRKMFLLCGKVSNPEKQYHMELLTKTPDLTNRVQKLLFQYEIPAKITTRKEQFLLYLKDGDEMVSFFALIGAMNAVLRIENVRVVKEVRNHINRGVNCETANLNKTANTVAKIRADLQFIDEKIGLSGLSDVLREVGLLRIQMDDLSMEELGKQCDPPIGKSAVNHRLRRIHQLAEELREKSSEKNKKRMDL